MNVSASNIANSLGIGSGIDLTGLASQLAEAQFAGRNARLTQKSETLERQISLAGSIRSSLSQFASALGDRLRTGDLAPAPSITNSAVAKVSAPVGSQGKGIYSLEVTQLAKTQTMTTPTYAGSTASVGAGTMTIRFGATSNAGFTEDTARTPLELTFAPGATLAEVAGAINSQNAGLSAYVAETEAGAQLVIKGAEGAKNGFVIDVAEDAAEPGLSALAWRPGSDPARLVQASADAKYTLDGIARTSASNTIDRAAPGLSFELTATNVGAPATVTFSNSKSALTSVMQDITGALNEIAKSLREAVDPKTGDLSRDTGARTLSRTLSGLGTIEIMPNAPAGSPRTLAELGLSIGRDGSYTLDTKRLTEVIERDAAGVSAMFTTGINGVFSTIDRIARANTISTDPGSLGGSIARFQSQSQTVGRDLEKLNEQMETLRATMVARFAKVDSKVAASQSTLSFLQSQIDVWNSQKN